MNKIQLKYVPMNTLQYVIYQRVIVLTRNETVNKYTACSSGVFTSFHNSLVSIGSY